MKSRTIYRFTTLLFCLLINVVSIAQYSTYIDPNTRELNKTSAKVGTLPGSIEVNALGGATYVIPIFISPGSAGMQPGVSIVYNSLIDEGVLGKGWDINGLSSIQRVPQDFYHEGKVGGVKLQNTDRFALDSNRLVLNSGTYGSDGSTYFTELETFVRVTAHGSAGTGPSWFEVETKDGATIEYGNTTSSKVEANGSSTVYLWRINKITDKFGNFIVFTYYENNGESNIEKIEYTGNTSANLEPYNKVEFYYGNRTDSNSVYAGGSRIPKTKILTSIKMKTEGGSLVREYQFKFAFDFYTHLNEIVEFGSDSTYYNSTVIGWGSSTTQFSSSDVFSNSSTKIFYLGDFNGDGRTDFVVTPRKTTYTSSDVWQLWLGTGDGTSFTYKNQGYLNSTFKGFTVADVDGNGNEDIFWKNVNLVTYQCNPHPCGGDMIVLNDTTGIDLLTEIDTSMSVSSMQSFLFNPPPPPQDTCWDQCSYTNIEFLYYYFDTQTGLVRGSSNKDHTFNNCPSDLTLNPIDLDGNGIPEYLVLEPQNSNHLYRVEGTAYEGTFYYFYNYKFLDFNGDKAKDILIVNGNNSVIYQYDPTTYEFQSIYSSSTFPTSNDKIFTGDFNGDKKTDLLYWNNGWGLKFSTGAGFSASTNVPSLTNTNPESSLTNNNIYVTDLNGDKKDDILEVYLDGGSSKLKCFNSQGDGVFSTDLNTYSKSSVNKDYFSFGDFNGDGKKDVFYYDYSSANNTVNVCFFRKNEKKHLVSCIANGLNHKTWIYYSPLNKGTDFYTRATGAQFPVVDLNGAIYAVDSTQVLNDVGLGYLTTLYTYQGLRTHNQGKGILGFQKIRLGDNGHDSIYTNLEYSYNSTNFYSYLAETSVWMKYEQIVISQNTNTISFKTYSNNRYFPYLSENIRLDNITNYNNGNYVYTTNTFDNYGNNTHVSIAYKDGTNTQETKEISNSYSAYGNWGGIPNKLTSSTSTSTYGQESSYSRTVNFTYDSYGKLLTETMDPGESKAVVKTYSNFNSFGLPGQIVLSANSLTSRTTQFSYDSKSRFITNHTNALSHSITKTYNVGTGNLTSEININNDTTSYEYDGFGNLVNTIVPSGNEVSSSLNWDLTTAGGENSLFYSLKTSPNNGLPDQYNYYEKDGRKVMTKTEGLDGPIYLTFGYSLGGTLQTTTLPYKPNETPKYIHYYYDLIGRKIAEDNNGLESHISYGNNEITTTDPAGRSMRTKTNSTGKIIQRTELVNENNQNNIYYYFYSNDQVKKISTNGTDIDFVYDQYGRQTSVTNPNSGTTTSQYNAFGELISQTDHNQHTFTFEYDVLGRITAKTGPDGTTSYSYITNGNGLEQINMVTGSNNISDQYSYDSLGRLIQLTKTIPDDQSFTTSFTYDNWGNMTSLEYPSGITINNVFDENGFLTQIKNGSNTIWTLDEINSQGQPVQFTLGSSLHTNFEYDDHGYLTMKKTGSSEQDFSFNNYTGNLTSRTFKCNDSIRTESFTYDNFDRLKTYFYGGQYTVNYTQNGNIDSKFDAGDYTYDESKLNAVTNVSNDYGVIPSVSQAITYTAFNKASLVQQDPYSLELTYGPDDQRIKSVLKNNNDTVKTRYYSAGYEKEITSSGVRELTYVNSPYGLIAVIIKEGSTELQPYYTVTDHLGSILGLLDAEGDTIERYSYDPWGRRRNPDNLLYNNVPVPTILDRGFTGHEHLDEFGLINMNGRMYDPTVGRFLNVDPVIQDPSSSQSLNGYSYCLNNPLKYIDQSEYSYGLFSWLINLFGGDPCAYKSKYQKKRERWERRNNGVGGEGIGTNYHSWDINLLPESIDLDDSNDNNFGDAVGGGGISGVNNSSDVDFNLPQEKIYYKLSYQPKPKPYDKYGWGLDITLGVFIKGYSQYNWIQTCYRTDNTYFVDVQNNCKDLFGFLFFQYDMDNDVRPWYCDVVLQDGPRWDEFHGQSFLSTLVGKKGNKWFPIVTFSWGYNIQNGEVVLIPFKVERNPHPTHILNVYSVLELHN